MLAFTVFTVSVKGVIFIKAFKKNWGVRYKKITSSVTKVTISRKWEKMYPKNWFIGMILIDLWEIIK